MVEGATRGIGMRTLLSELGVAADIILHTDSSAAKALASRKGVGRLRHIETRWMWLQIEVAKGRIQLEKVRGDLNPADILTKYKNMHEIEELLYPIGLEVCRRM